VFVLYLWLIPISHYRPTAGQRQTGVNLFTLTGLTTKQNIYYQRL